MKIWTMTKNKFPSPILPGASAAEISKKPLHAVTSLTISAAKTSYKWVPPDWGRVEIHFDSQPDLISEKTLKFYSQG